MFFFKKIVSAFLLPVPIGLFLLLLALFFLLTNSYRKAKLFLVLGFLWFALLSFQPISNAIINPLENAHRALIDIPKVEYVLVLGSGHTSNENLSVTSQLRSVATVRINEGIRILKVLENENKKIVFSGYKGFDKNHHSYMSSQLALSLDVSKEKIIKLDKPVDTRQEAIEMKKLVGKKPFILVTSASHMKRSILLFKKLGLNPIPAPTYHLGYEDKGYNSIFSSQNIYKVKVAFHEYLGLTWSYIRGYI